MKLINHDFSRELSQMKWAIFGNEDVEIISEIKDDFVITTVEINGKKATDKTKYFEKNDVKRSLLKASKEVFDVDTPWGILTGINPSKLALSVSSKEEFSEKFMTNKRQTDLSFEVSNFTNSLEVSKNDISLYIGIPFCATKCKYCSFVSNSIDTANKYMTRYVDCLIREIEHTAKLIKTRKLKTIYIGGGTPTALDFDNLKRLLDAVDSNFSKENLIEYTVEAGRADTITREKLELLKQKNVDRISINPQVFDDKILEEIGRNHTVLDVLDIYKIAKELNFKAINMDIIYGLGGDFSKTVDILMELEPENITMHTLAIKKGSKIDKTYTAKLGDINYFYEKINEKYDPYYMYRQQYMIKPYENVGFSKKGFECLYNVYMMENMMDILALGSGSTSKIAGESHFNNKYPLDYINNIENILEKKQLILKKEN